MCEKFLKKNNRHGVTMLMLVVIVVILAILTGTVINSSFEDDGVIEGTESNVSEQQRQMLIENIRREIQILQVRNEVLGKYTFTVVEDIMPILQRYGVYDNATLKLTTDEGAEIYLYEIMQIPMLEYAKIEYEDSILTITSPLITNGYVIEYTADNGEYWNAYMIPVELDQSGGIYTRVKNNEGEIISNTIKVKEGIMQSEDLAAPIIRIVTNKSIGESINVTILVTEYGELAADNVYQYYVSTSETVQENGEWKNYIPGQRFTIGEGLEGDYYIHVRALSDAEGNTSESKVSGPITITSATENRVLSSISVTKAPNKTEYNHGETFNNTGMIVKATYTNGTQREITDYIITNSILAYGQISVAIVYTENEVTKQTTTPVKVNKVLSSISVTKAPNKTEYYHGETFDKTGMIVKARYTDGSSTEITEYTVTNGTLAYGQTSITISYTENDVTKTATTPVTVSVENVLSSISVTKAPNKTEYNTGETFDKTGMIVKATYKNGTSAEITEYTVTNGTLVDGQTSVTISYTEYGVTKTTTTPVTVRSVLSSIAVTKVPNKIEYNHGETFNNAGMIVKVTYTNGTSAEITGYTVTNGTLAYGQTSVTISYTENGVTKTTTTLVKVKRVLSSIAVTKVPNKTEYNHGQTFNKTGMIVKATYTDGGSAEITGYTVTNGTLAYSQTSVTISYTENGVTKTTTTPVTVKRVLSSIAVTTPPNKTEYYEYETFDITGMVVKATYTDGGSEQVIGYTVTNSTLTYGNTSVTIRYTENGLTRTTTTPVTVNKRVLVSVVMKTPPNKTVYEEGELFDLTGLVLTATYEDGGSRDVKGYSITDFVVEYGMTSLRLTYTENGVSLPVSIAITVTRELTNLVIASNPTKTQYVVGEQFNPKGMVVKATFASGNEVEITNYTVVNGILANGQTSVTISYTQGSVTKTATVPVTVSTLPPNWTLANLNTSKPYVVDNTSGTSYIAPIPKGFSVKEGTVSTGLVIQDSNNNEYVWVPVNDTYTIKPAEQLSITETTAIQYWQNNATGSSRTETIGDNTYSISEPSTATSWETAEYQAMTASVLKYGGFYVARYVTGGTSDSPVVKSGQSPLVGMFFKDITPVARNMYASNNSNYGAVSTLIYGIQWDTMMYWANCSQYNTEATNTLYYTGAIAADNFKNIRDIVTSVPQWTMEYGYAIEQPYRMIRGGSTFSGQLVRERLAYFDYVSISVFGHRIALYVK